MTTPRPTAGKRVSDPRIRRWLYWTIGFVSRFVFDGLRQEWRWIGAFWRCGPVEWTRSARPIRPILRRRDIGRGRHRCYVWHKGRWF